MTATTNILICHTHRTENLLFNTETDLISLVHSYYRCFTSSSEAINGFGFDAFCSFDLEGLVSCGASEIAMGAVCAVLTLRFRATHLLILSLSAVTAVFISRINISSVRPWPNDSTFHSIFSSTFDIKVERLLSVVEHRWPNGSIFRSTFLSTFQLVNLCTFTAGSERHFLCKPRSTHKITNSDIVFSNVYQ